MIMQITAMTTTHSDEEDDHGDHDEDGHGDDDDQ